MKFKVVYQQNHQIKSTIIANMQDKMPNNIIKISKIKTIKDYFSLPFYSYKEIIEIFKELSLILNTNISLGEALHILIKGNDDKKIDEILMTIKSAIDNGRPIYKALEQHRKYIGDLPILFFNLGDSSGNMKESINALSVLLIENQKAKKKFSDALSYPLVLTITLIISIILIFNFVIPKFEHIFIQFGSNLPQATKALLYTKSFFSDNYIYLIMVFSSSIVLFKYYYSSIKIHLDKFIILHLPILGSLYKDFLLYRFFLSLTMLIKSKFTFQISLRNTTLLIDNSYINYKLTQIINDIQNGQSISKAFEHTKLFNHITLRLLYTAQQTNTMPLILEDITNIYKQKLNKNIQYFSQAIGPIFIMIISILILWLIFALMLPIWDLSSVLN